MLGRAAVHLKQRGPLCDRKGEHANVTKVGFWHWLPLKQLAAECRAWQPVARNVTGVFHDLAILQWRLRLRVMIYRKQRAASQPQELPTGPVHPRRRALRVRGRRDEP